ncbi:uncharacterized protein [Diadema antillarum]|uniref:uncharacterized protein n=1 Tax=Diadema antillarum TaxID=105358 RepID=UPI003A85809E
MSEETQQETPAEQAPVEETAPAPQPHERKTQPDEDDDDPVDAMIKKTGCLELHYAVQECMADNRDWRKCQDQVAAFGKCIGDYTMSQAKEAATE